MLILVAIGALGQLGVQTTSLLAVIGAAGLAIGLALQGTLSNIAAGIMLLWLRPFHVGDFIEVGGQSGTVEEIGLFVCQLRTYDGLFLFMPNSAIWNAALKNYTRNGGRLVSINVAVPAAIGLDRARQTLLAVAARTPSTLDHPAPAVFVDRVDDGAMVLNLAVWTTPQGTGTVQQRRHRGSQACISKHLARHPNTHRPRSCAKPRRTAILRAISRGAWQRDRFHRGARSDGWPAPRRCASG